jgi:hypothetical protein
LSDTILYKTTAKSVSSFTENLRPVDLVIIKKLLWRGHNIRIALSNDAFRESIGEVDVYPIYVKNGNIKTYPKRIEEFFRFVAMIARSSTPEWTDKGVKVNRSNVVAYQDKIKQVDLPGYIPTYVITSTNNQPNAYPNKATITRDDHQFQSMFDGYTQLVVKSPKGRYISLVENKLDIVNAEIVRIQMDYLALRNKRIDVLIQPFMPAETIDEVRGLRTRDNALLESSDKKIELRMVVSMDSLMTQADSRRGIYALGRVVDMHKQVDQFVELRQDSVPENFFSLAFKAARDIYSKTDSKGMQVVVDCFQYNGQAFVMETNVRNPNYSDEYLNHRDSTHQIMENMVGMLDREIGLQGEA